jgi:hypothetical protein
LMVVLAGLQPLHRLSKMIIRVLGLALLKERMPLSSNARGSKAAAVKKA